MIQFSDTYLLYSCIIHCIISSSTLPLSPRNAVTALPGVAMAAVVAVPHPKWDERPVVVAARQRPWIYLENHRKTIGKP